MKHHVLSRHLSKIVKNSNLLSSQKTFLYFPNLLSQYPRDRDKSIFGVNFTKNTFLVLRLREKGSIHHNSCYCLSSLLGSVNGLGKVASIYFTSALNTTKRLNHTTAILLQPAINWIFSYFYCNTLH